MLSKGGGCGGGRAVWVNNELKWGTVSLERRWCAMVDVRFFTLPLFIMSHFSVFCLVNLVTRDWTT